MRGKHGSTSSVNVYELVVGDIILIETGAKIPADCVIIEGNDIIMDEAFYNEIGGGKQ